MKACSSARLLLALTAVIFLAACGDDNNKIGSTVKGERVAVMEQAKALEADKDLKGRTPDLPRMGVNLTWPQAGYDSEHAMPYSQFATKPQIIWKQSIGDGSDSSFKLLAPPVVGRGGVYTMDSRGRISAINSMTGAVLWKLETTPKHSDDDAIGGGLALDDKVLFATTGFGNVLAIDAKTGKVKWTTSLRNPLRAAPAVADNRVYALSVDDRLNALDAQTGKILWHQEGIAESATLMGAASPAVEGDNVVVAYNSGEIANLRVQNGRSTWTYSLAMPSQTGALPAIADIRGLPVIESGKVYAVSHGGRMVCIDQRSGERVWENDISGINTPVIAGDTIFLYGGDTQLMALARDSGLPIWVQTLPKRVDMQDKKSDPLFWTGPLLVGERLWMVNSQGHLVSFSPADGAMQDTIDLKSPLYLTPVVADRTMFVVTDDGDLVALR